MSALSDFAASISELTEAVRAANADPADAIRQLSALAAHGLPAAAPAGADPVGIAGFRAAGPSGLWANTARYTDLASYTDAAGVVRYAPPECVRPVFAADGAVTGYLDEASATNLQASSAAMALGSGRYSIGANATDGGLVAAPDLTLSARRVTSNNASGANHYFSRNGNLTVAASTAYTLSFYARLNAGTGATGRVLTVDESNGTTTTRSNGTAFSSMSPLAAGGAWRRFTRTITTRSDTASMMVYWLDGPFSGEAHDVWGCQIEAGGAATSFIPTPVGSSALRYQDAVFLRAEDRPSPALESQRAAKAATAALCRRAALASLARAVAAWEPATSGEARDTLRRVMPLYDAEIGRAGDAADDGAFAALRALRAAVADDLHARGLRLPEVVRVHRPRSQPGLVVAHALYQDAKREPELTRRADPVHPLFYGLDFDALSA